MRSIVSGDVDRVFPHVLVGLEKCPGLPGFLQLLQVQPQTLPGPIFKHNSTGVGECPNITERLGMKSSTNTWMRWSNPPKQDIYQPLFQVYSSEVSKSPGSDGFSVPSVTAFGLLIIHWAIFLDVRCCRFFIMVVGLKMNPFHWSFRKFILGKVPMFHHLVASSLLHSIN